MKTTTKMQVTKTKPKR